MCLVAEPNTVAGEVLHHGLPDQASSGDPRADLECHGGVPVPPSHPALPDVLPSAQSAAVGGSCRGALQLRPRPLSHPGPTGRHHGTLQVCFVTISAHVKCLK